MADLAPRPPLARAAWLVAAGVAALLLSTAGRYGIFRDEYYYLMCAAHPAWGYVDHPPLAMAFLAAWTAAFGDGVVALRVPPALAVGATSLLGALLARELRGGAAAQTLAAVTVGLMPGMLALGSFYSMNAFDVVFWAAIAWIACRLLDPSASRRWWWALGAAVGLGLLNKYSVLFLAVGLGAGVLLSPLRRELLSRPRMAGSLLVVAIVLPHLAWQVREGWPTLAFMRNVMERKNVALGPAAFWGEQMLMAHPLFLPLGMAGLACLLAWRRLRPWRPLGVAFGVVALWLTVSHAKPYYLVPAYVLVLPAGAVAAFAWLGRWRRTAGVAAVALPVLLGAAGLVIAPLAIPLLPPADFVAWEQALGVRPKSTEHNAVGDLPQHFADRFGWRELADTVRGVTDRLTPAERARCLVVTDNYGECGALNYWGLSEGVRPAVSGHNSCFTWWPEGFVPEVVVLVGSSREGAEAVFEHVEAAAVHRAPLAMPYEAELTIWVCRGWKVDPGEAREGARFAI